MIYYCPICGLSAVRYYYPDNYKIMLNNMEINDKMIDRIFKKLEKCIILMGDNKILRNSYQDGYDLLTNESVYDWCQPNININYMREHAGH